MKNSLFFISLSIALILLLVENIIGIHWDFHPDAITYTSESYAVVSNVFEKGLFAIFNNFYYFIAALMFQNTIALIVLNIFIYSITNVLIFKYIKDIALTHNITFNYKLKIFIICLLFMPYRIHLSVHVLKDTLIIFFLINLMSSKKVNCVFNAIFALGTRLFSAAYFSVFIEKKYFYILAFSFMIICLFNLHELEAFLHDKNETDMTFREFDTVPNFAIHGLMGVILRAVVWPLLAFSGGYILLSPSIAFAPLALGSMMITLVSFWAIKKPPINLQALMVFSLIALLTTGFTTYIRYCFPLLVLMPILQFKAFANNLK